jgi:hypothetical protein
MTSIWGSSDVSPVQGSYRFPVDTSSTSGPGHVTAAELATFIGGGSSGVTSLNTLIGAINLIPGANFTITPSGNNLVLAATGGGGGGVTRSINNISSNTNAGSVSGTDYAYFCTNSPTLTLPNPVGNTNLYTVTNQDIGTTTIATVSGLIGGSSTQSLFGIASTGSLLSDGTNWNFV